MTSWRETRAPTRAGYVYVLSNPALEGRLKVGRTQRSPARRAQELSDAGVPQGFHVEHARFFWDCWQGEKAVHQGLLARAIPKDKEFFQAPLDVVLDVLLASANPGPKTVKSPISDVNENRWGDDWMGSAEGLEARFEWANEAWTKGTAFDRADAWQLWERLSAEGYGLATWRLAHATTLVRPTLDGARQAAWMFEAAEAQGEMGGRLRGAWLRSWLDVDGMQAWYVTLHQAWERWGSEGPMVWPVAVVETLALEVEAWSKHPARHHRHPWWSALQQRWAQEKAWAGEAWSAEQEALARLLERALRSGG